MCGRHTDNRARCPECHEEAIDPRNRRPWLQQEACAYCGTVFSVVQLEHHGPNCEQRPLRCPYYVTAGERLVRCEFRSNTEADALPHMRENHLNEFVDAFYVFTEPRALGEPLSLTR